MVRRQRLDAELVRRGLARSRQQAGELVHEGRVTIGGRAAVKAATQVELGEAIVVAERDGDADYVSRGAFKLAGALDAFPDLVVAGRRCLDAGASTGGFTDVLLRRGARSVVAVDVGYGQLAWSLRQDERVTVLDRTNVRELSHASVDPPAELVVADLSFISLRLVIRPLAQVSVPAADFVLMVKPQFEVGRQWLGAGGVVRDPELRVQAVLDVAEAAAGEGLGVQGVVASPLPGPSGNVEYFLWLRREPEAQRLGGDPLEQQVRAAVRAGPQGAVPHGAMAQGAGPQGAGSQREEVR
ncbi:MAG: TlyA family RNA methyltransferase [Actinomycetes bacterium]